ncbi:MAG: DNA-directed RNA polymerase subunit alpha [Candidatus Berkelbacteria bacterium]|nr:DNA-directed RNA polymerase subunit alpha [Candidatus Berkelbacteria bacterium]
MEYTLPDLNLLEVKSALSKDGRTGVFTIEPLSPGYGVTVGNTLRRILLASLEGFAIKSIKINGVDHEYSVIKGVKEDVVDLVLNLKAMRLKLVGADEASLKLAIKGPKKVTADDFGKNASVELTDKSYYLCTIEKSGKLELEINIDKGRGYVPIEKRTEEKAPIGTIMVDSVYTPVKKVRFDVENARVGGMTNYNKLTIEITTDGSVSPAQALQTAAQIMSEHLQIVITACDQLPGLKVKKQKGKKTK